MVHSDMIVAEVMARLKPIMDFEPIEKSDCYTIGQLSSHLKVSLRTLRFYEQAGLLNPDRAGLRRLYSRDDLERLEVIVTLRELEVSLTAIKSLMMPYDEADGEAAPMSLQQVSAVLSTLADENRARIAELERINARISDARRSFERA